MNLSIGESAGMQACETVARENYLTLILFRFHSSNLSHLIFPCITCFFVALSTIILLDQHKQIDRH